MTGKRSTSAKQKKAEQEESEQLNKVLDSLKRALSALQTSDTLSHIGSTELHAVCDELRSTLPARSAGASLAELSQSLAEQHATAEQGGEGGTVGGLDFVVTQEAAQKYVSDAQEQHEAADKLEAELVRLRSEMPLDVKMMHQIVKSNVSLVDLMFKWFRDGDISMSSKEFRSQLKKLGLQVDPKAADNLFDSLDSNKNGRLELHELQPILKKLKVAATAAANEQEKVIAGASEMRRIAAAYIAAARDEETLAKEEAALAEAMKQMPLMVYLVEALAKRKFSVTDFLRALDEDNDGAISLDEWRRHMAGATKLEIVAPQEQMDALFNELDTDKDGMVTNEELRLGLKIMQTKADESRAELSKWRKYVAGLRRHAAQAQIAFVAAREAEEAQRRKLAEQEERERLAAAEAAAESAAKRAEADKAAKEKEKAQKAADKAAFQARVEARRLEAEAAAAEAAKAKEAAAAAAPKAKKGAGANTERKGAGANTERKGGAKPEGKALSKSTKL